MTSLRMAYLFSVDREAGEESRREERKTLNQCDKVGFFTLTLALTVKFVLFPSQKIS